MKLYELIPEIEACVKLDDEHAVNTETGELIDVAALDALKLERDTKIENISLWIKNLNSDAEALKAEKNAFAERERTAKNKADQLKKYLTECLEGSSFKTEKVSISFRKSESIEVEDVYKVPEEFLKYKEPDVDKMAIKRILKAGNMVTGCRLVEKQNIQIK